MVQLGRIGCFGVYNSIFDKLNNDVLDIYSTPLCFDLQFSNHRRAEIIK